MPWLQFFSENPLLSALQAALVAAVALSVYLIFYATRDVLLRSSSLVFQIFCIVLVAVLPILGFFLYLLIRPAETLRQRETCLLVVRIAALQEQAKGKKQETGAKMHESVKKGEEGEKR
jgi:hypothetical protein